VRKDAERICVRCPAVGVLTERFPQADKLRAFADLEARLGNIAAVAQVGGRTAAERLAATANEQLQTDHPGTRRWSVEELAMVRARPDGGRFIQFRRKLEAQPGRAPEWWVTSVTEAPGRATCVSVVPPESVVR
jgi:hypothetical protein